MLQYYDSVMPCDPEVAPGPAAGKVCRRGSWPPCRPAEPHCDTEILLTTTAFRIQSDCVSEVRNGINQIL